MDVELDQALLDPDGGSALVILALCAYGSTGRHRVVPDNRDAWDSWAATLPIELAEELQFAWDESERRMTEGGASTRIEVKPGNRTDFKRDPLVVDLLTAHSLLGRPLRVILENGRNDRSFLMAFSDAPTAKAILTAEGAGWLIFETAGGIGEIKVRTDADHESIDLFRILYIVDSDSTVTGVPSALAADVENNLRTMGTFHRRPPGYFGLVLSRRAAENYAPPGALLAWARDQFGAGAWQLLREAETPQGRARLEAGPGDAGSARRKLIAAIAFRELPSSTRAVLDMKHGRGESGSRTDSEIWNSLTSFQQKALEYGFGAGMSFQFYRGQRHLPDETGEVVEFLRLIIERL